MNITLVPQEAYEKAISDALVSYRNFTWELDILTSSDIEISFEFEHPLKIS